MCVRDTDNIKFRWFIEPRFLVTLGTLCLAALGGYSKLVTFMETITIQQLAQDKKIEQLESRVNNTDEGMGTIKAMLARLDERTASILMAMQQKSDRPLR